MKEKQCNHTKLEMLHTYSETSAMCLCLSLTQSMSSSFRRACFSEPSLDLYLNLIKQKTMPGNILATFRKNIWIRHITTRHTAYLNGLMECMKDGTTCRCHSGYRWGRKPWPGRSAHAGLGWLGQSLSPISTVVPVSFPWDRKLQNKSVGIIITLQENMGVSYLCLLPIVGLYKEND